MSGVEDGVQVGWMVVMWMSYGDGQMFVVVVDGDDSEYDG